MNERFINSIGVGLWLLFGGLLFIFWLSPSPELEPLRDASPKPGPWNGNYKVKGVRYSPMQAESAESYSAEGWASWYGEETYRRPGGTTTAMGESFHPSRLSAAHRTLPLPTNVRVTNLENGRSLNVRVNDRGPFPSDRNPSSGKRLIDLSAAAAKKLGFYRNGLAWVKVEVVD